MSKGKVKLVKFLFEIFINVRTRVTLARMDFKEKVSGNVFFLRRFIFMFVTIKSWSWILPRKKVEPPRSLKLITAKTYIMFSSFLQKWWSHFS